MTLSTGPFASPAVTVSLPGRLTARIHEQVDDRAEVIERVLRDLETAERQVDISLAVMKGAKLSIASCCWQLKALTIDGQEVCLRLKPHYFRHGKDNSCRINSSYSLSALQGIFSPGRGS